MLHGWKHPRAQILKEEDDLKKNKKMEEKKEAPPLDLLIFSPFPFSSFF